MSPRVRRTGRTTHGILHAIAECVYRGQRILYVKPWNDNHVIIDIIRRLNNPVKLSFVVDMQGRDGVFYRDHSYQPLTPAELRLRSLMQYPDPEWIQVDQDARNERE